MSEPPTLNSAERDVVLQLASDSIRTQLATGHPLTINQAEYTPILQRETATFVTLLLDGQLRGCCGSVLPVEPLVVNVGRSASSAAFHDPRFESLMPNELPLLELHVSLLSHPLPIHYQDESDLLSQLRPDTDGLILRYLSLKGVFLPSVWKHISSRSEFLNQLKIKAGLPPIFWSSNIHVQRFTVEEIVGNAADYLNQAAAGHS